MIFLEDRRSLEAGAKEVNEAIRWQEIGQQGT